MHSPKYCRRKVIAGAASTLLLSFSNALSRQVVKEIHELQPGEFTWHPERSEQGPVAIIVSLDDQRVHVYRNGVRIAVSTCSTGRKGHETPTGVFTILQKDKNHHSSTYNNAPMPNMNRLTWKGIALHAGKLPGYPASHGCVRLPMAFSEKLFSITHIGTPVIIADQHSAPQRVVHPGMILSSDAEAEFINAEAKLKKKRLPGFTHEDNPTAPLSIVVSGADGAIDVLQNGNVLASGKATITNARQPLGSHVFIYGGAGNGANMQWHSIRHGSGGNSEVATVMQRIKADPKLVRVISDHLHPGATLVTVDLPLNANTRTGRDFVVATTTMPNDN